MLRRKQYLYVARMRGRNNLDSGEQSISEPRLHVKTQLATSARVFRISQARTPWLTSPSHSQLAPVAAMAVILLKTEEIDAT